MSKEINIYKTQSTIDSTDQDLDLNTDIVHNKTNTYNSLSDLYGIQSVSYTHLTLPTN